jgi:hypothetical protein
MKLARISAFANRQRKPAEGYYYGFVISFSLEKPQSTSHFITNGA